MRWEGFEGDGGTMSTMIDVRGWLLAGVFVLAMAAPVAAQGWIEPGVIRGGSAVAKTRSEVRVRVEGRVAQIEVSEWFINNGRRLAEGDYHYPLPGEAVFQGFSLFQGDAELRGEIMDAERARAIYEEIVRRRADPALIELAGQGLLRARIFPIQPGEERRVTLRYTQVLSRAGDALQFVYSGGVRSSSTGQAHQEPIETIFEVEVLGASRFMDPFSPTHDLELEREAEVLRVSIEEEITGRLSLFLPVSGEAVGLSVATHRPVGEDGYFMLTLSPGRDVVASEPRDVTVVLDVSGSMSGEKIEQAKQALHQLLSTLSRDDRFRLIAFSNAVRIQSREWTYARGAGLERAGDWVDDLVADGGTNIGAALDEAFRLESPRSRLPVVLFLTDGLPSVGEQSPERLADRAEEQAGRTRVFAFGVGHDVNTHLLDRLGEAGRGDTDYVEPGENVERVISLLTAKIQHPVLTELELSAGRIDLEEVYPVRVPDVFAGEELVLFGRFSGDGTGAITVTGERQGSSVSFATDVTFPEESEANQYIPRLWASRKLGHLERQIWTEGESQSLVEEMRRLALRYGLPSRYTSYLVEEPDAFVRSPVGSRIGGRTFNQPAPSGAGAVRAAEVARQRREIRSAGDLDEAEKAVVADLLERDDTASPTRAVGGRLFRLQDGVWTDAAHRPRSGVTRIKAYSAAYFAVLSALPELEPVLTELDKVLVAGAEASVGVDDAGIEEISPSELRSLVNGFRGVDGA
jgi:Ca-activated chloride channel family protein